MSNSIVEQLHRDEIQLVDVRTDSEREENYVDGSIHVPLHDLESGIDPELKKEIPIYVYCRSGARSEKAKRALIEMGYDDVHNAGGLTNLLA